MKKVLQGVGRRVRRMWIPCSSLAAALLLASCPLIPFDAAVAKHVSDKVAPVIAVASPQDGSPYSSAIEITGTVSDLADANATPGRVTSLAYEVLASDVKGNIEIGADGAFDCTFLATKLNGAITIRLTAIDWNKNETRITFGMVDSGKGIPGFTATASSGSVTLTWPPVPLTDHYELYYEQSDTLPSSQFSRMISPVTSGYAMTGIANGGVYAFLLRSVPTAASGAEAN
jgi:hypothetical protein